MKVVDIHLTREEQRQLDNAQESRFLSVDPLTSKYPELTPYQYASNRPIECRDLDGKEAWNSTSVFTEGGGIAGGLAYGANFGVRLGTAYDMVGKTQFLMYSNVINKSSDFADGSPNPMMVFGLEAGVDVAYQWVHKPTFTQAMNSMGLSMSTVDVKFGPGGSVSFGDDNFGFSLGYGIGGSIKTGNQTVVPSFISITNKESNKTHLGSTWVVKNQTPTYDENNKINGYDGQVVEILTGPGGLHKIKNNTGITVHSGAVTSETVDNKGRKTTTTTTNGKWQSEGYKKAAAKLQDGN